MSDERLRLNHVTIWLTVVVITAFVIAYFPVWKRLVLAWYSSEEYSHGFFVVPLCLYILWQKRKKLAETKVSPCTWGLAVVIFSLSLYLFAHLAQILTITSFSMVLILAGIITYLYGFRMMKELVFPLFLLLFMIPIPAQIYSALTIPLQLFVSKASVWIAAAFGIPIYREGNIIHLPDRTMQVVQACSGLRSIISLLALSAVLGYFTLRASFLRAVLFVSGIPAAILVNIVRVLLLVVAFHYFNFDLTSGLVHTIFGLFIFLLALIFIIAVKGVLTNWDTYTIAR